MPTSAPNFQFTDYAQQLQNVERRRKLSEALLQQGLEPVQNQPAVGGIVIPNSPWATLAQVAKAGVGGYGIAQSEKKTEEISKNRQADLAKALQSMGVTDPNVQMMLNMPETAGLGQSQLQMQMLKNALNRGQTPANPMDQTSTNPSVMAGAAGTTPPRSGPVMPQAPIDLLGAGDMGKTVYNAIIEQNKPINVRPGGTVYNPGQGPQYTAPQGGMQIQQGPNGPQARVVPGFAEAQTALHSIPNPSAPLISVKTSTGQDIQLTQPEYLKFQSTGQLPARMQGQSPQSGIPAPFNPSSPQGRPGLGTVGVGQSQEEQITQARQQAAGKSADEQFAKDYIAFKTGGAQDATKQLAQLQDVQRLLQEGKSNLTGPMVGRVPDVIRGVTNPQAIAMRERVEEVVQRSLRAILGAQFTEREGERLIARAYNPSQPEAENAMRVQRLMTQLGEALKAKTDAAGYFEKNGTLQGWSGKLPSISDFNMETKRLSTDDLVNKWLQPSNRSNKP